MLVEFGREVAPMQLQELIAPLFNVNSTALRMVNGKDNGRMFLILVGYRCLFRERISGSRPKHRRNSNVTALIR